MEALRRTRLRSEAMRLMSDPFARRDELAKAEALFTEALQAELQEVDLHQGAVEPDALSQHDSGLHPAPLSARHLSLIHI